MSRGFGTIQRAMLFRLAQHEVGLAEMAAELQRPYRSPDRWSLRGLIAAVAHGQITARQREAHDGWQETLKRFHAGDKDAQEVVAIRANIYAIVHRSIDLDLKEFEPRRPQDYELQRLNPSRAILGLERRSFVLRDRDFRHKNLALTVEGFAEARRLGGVPTSEIVDLDQMQANWREPGEFRLAVPGFFPREDDADAVRWAHRRATETVGP